MTQTISLEDLWNNGHSKSSKSVYDVVKKATNGYWIQYDEHTFGTKGIYFDKYHPKLITKKGLWHGPWNPDSYYDAGIHHLRSIEMHYSFIRRDYVIYKVKEGKVTYLDFDITFWKWANDMEAYSQESLDLDFEGLLNYLPDGAEDVIKHRVMDQHRDLLVKLHEYNKKNQSNNE